MTESFSLRTSDKLTKPFGGAKIAEFFGPEVLILYAQKFRFSVSLKVYVDV
jgi:hypothetical protein